MEKESLQEVAREMRADIVKSIFSAGSGHPGGSLSAADLLAVLFFDCMKNDPARPDWPERDRFVLSKGHAAPCLYAALAERGYFPKEALWTLRKKGSILQGHPCRLDTPGVEVSTGSLGQGFSVAVGMALAAQSAPESGRVYCLLGDGELQEGIVWEAAMAAAHYGLDKLTAIVDWNGLQIDGSNEEVMTVAPIAEKFRSFGWEVREIDGHDVPAIQTALAEAKECKGKPCVIIAKTVKGKGVSFMEDQVGWHGKAPNEEQARQAVAELGGEW